VAICQFYSFPRSGAASLCPSASSNESNCGILTILLLVPWEKNLVETVCKPAPLQPWFRCMPPVHLDHQTQGPTPWSAWLLQSKLQAQVDLGAQQASRLGSAPCRSLSRVVPPPPQVISYSHLPRCGVSLHSHRTRMISHAWIHFFTATSTCVIRRRRCVPLCRSRMPPPLYDYCRWWVKIRFISGNMFPFGCSFNWFPSLWKVNCRIKHHVNVTVSHKDQILSRICWLSCCPILNTVAPVVQTGGGLVYMW